MSAERGYLRETGNLVFHASLVGVLVTVLVTGGFAYTGQRVIVEDSTVVSMAKSNAGDFPNNGNGRSETAGCKCLLSADLLRGKVLDVEASLRREGLPCRRIAIRPDSRRAAADRRRIRAEAKRRGITPSRETLLRAGWRILVTNVPAEMLPAEKISALYALRWSIEM